MCWLLGTSQKAQLGVPVPVLRELWETVTDPLNRILECKEWKPLGYTAEALASQHLC